MSKTFRRDQLRRLAEQGRLVLTGSYHFDDMHGEDRTQGATIPVALQESGADWKERVAGVAYLHTFNIQSGSGRAWLNENGTVTLYVHSNCNYTFRILEKQDAKPYATLRAATGSA